MANYLDKLIDGTAEKVPSKTSHVEREKQNHVLSAAENLLRISRESLKRFWKKIFCFAFVGFNVFRSFKWVINIDGMQIEI